MTPSHRIGPQELIWHINGTSIDGSVLKCLEAKVATGLEILKRVLGAKRVTLRLVR